MHDPLRAGVALSHFAVATCLTLLLNSVVACGNSAPSAPDLRIALVALGPEVATDSMGADFPSLDGRCTALAFASAGEIYVRSLATGQTTHVSAAPDGSPANQRSGLPRLSADASHIAFASAASNLVPGDTNGSVDSFVRDSRAGRTIAVSVSDAGVQGNGDSTLPSISGDGQLVVFASDASNLVPGDTNGKRDIFLRNLAAKTTRRLTHGYDGGEANGSSDFPSIGLDGRFVAFASEAYILHTNASDFHCPNACASLHGSPECSADS